MKGFKTAFWSYTVDNDDFPNDTNLILPAGMANAISQSVWDEGPAIGGSYNYEGPNFYPYTGIAIMNPPSSTIMRSLDRQLDDGNLSTGSFRLISANGRYTYIIDE